jgi:hypothetical protein
MSRRSWTLIVVVVVLGVLVGGYFWLSRPKTAAAPAAQKLPLSVGDKDTLVKMVLTDRKEGTMTLVKNGKAWTMEPPAPAWVTFEAGTMDDLAGLFTSLYAEEVVDEKPTDLRQFGLQPPKATAIGRWSDGTTHTLLLGDKTPTGSAYYVQVKGDPKVYAVYSGSGDQFHWTSSDLRSKAITPALNYDEITQLKIVERGGTTIEARAKTEEEAKSFQLGFGRYVLTRPYAYPCGLDSQKQDQLIKGTQGISISSFVDDQPSNLAKYGLDHPWGEALVRDKTSTVDFLFGAEKDSTQTYFMLRGHPSVYSTDTPSLSFMNTKPFDIVDKFTFIPSIEDVERIEITAGGKTHVLAISRTTKKAEKAGEADEVTATYTMDGKSAEEENFKKFYQVLIGLQIEGEVKHAVPDKPEVSVRYMLNKGASKTVTLDFAPYDRDFYAVFMNGVNLFALTRQQVGQMTAKLDALLRGEKITD